jgi:hypothetical protein
VPSTTNEDRIRELEKTVAALNERVDNVRHELRRIESTVNERKNQWLSFIQAIGIAVITFGLTLLGQYMIKRLS